jgi:hypothetical protein
MNWWLIALIVYGLGLGGIWAFIGYEMTKPGAQSQHGGELIGCAAAFIWPVLVPMYLYSRLKGDG